MLDGAVIVGSVLESWLSGMGGRRGVMGHQSALAVELSGICGRRRIMGH